VHRCDVYMQGAWSRMHQAINSRVGFISRFITISIYM
jgi:hypothetical protein